MGRDQEADYILVGKVVKPHGLKGEVKILPYSGDPANFIRFTMLLIADPHDQEETLCRVIRSRIQGKMVIVALDNIRNRDDSEFVVGRQVWALKDELPELAENEFYWQDMKGMRVVCENGRELGVVTDLLAGGAHDILVITGKGREYMIPAVNEFIAETDFDQGLLVVNPPSGLLEINN